MRTLEYVCVCAAYIFITQKETELAMLAAINGSSNGMLRASFFCELSFLLWVRQPLAFLYSGSSESSQLKWWSANIVIFLRSFKTDGEKKINYEKMMMRW